MLRSIVDATQCALVLSSFWRLRDENLHVLREALAAHGACTTLPHSVSNDVLPVNPDRGSVVYRSVDAP